MKYSGLIKKAAVALALLSIAAAAAGIPYLKKYNENEQIEMATTLRATSPLKEANDRMEVILRYLSRNDHSRAYAEIRKARSWIEDRQLKIKWERQNIYYSDVKLFQDKGFHETCIKKPVEADTRLIKAFEDFLSFPSQDGVNAYTEMGVASLKADADCHQLLELAKGEKS